VKRYGPAPAVRKRTRITDEPRCAACGTTQRDSGRQLFRHCRNGDIIHLCYDCSEIRGRRFEEPCVDEDELRGLEEFWKRHEHRGEGGESA
jgi:hypothetical protein